MKIALVHDHLTQDGGAEKVLQAFQELYPDNETFTLIYDQNKVDPFFKTQKINPSFLQKIPGAKKHYQWFLPLMPAATERYNLDEFNVVLSSASAFAKGIIPPMNTLHVCYCHTPTRYLWSNQHEYIKELKKNFLIKKILPLYLTKLRLWDKMAADRVHEFVANSHEVKKRINNYYQKPSEVIYPPVETEKFSISKNVGNYFLTGGRLVYYKRFDITIKAFNRLGLPLKIFGSGPQLKELQKIAKPNIQFLGRVSEKEKAKLYSQALAFINPQIEDFGITPVESMACGRPVIAFAAAGALETVIQNKTGLFFHEQTWEDLLDKIVRFRPENFNPQEIREHALKFDKEKFKQKIDKFVREKWEKFS